MLPFEGKENNTDFCSCCLYKLIQEIEFMKDESFGPEELDAFVSLLQLAAQNKFLEQRRRGSPGHMPSKGKSISSLEAMGIKIYGVDEPNMGESKSEISWENIAGYSQQKRYVSYYG